MPVLTATATCAAFCGVVEATGEQVTSRRLAERVGWLAALVQELAAQVVAAHWREESLDVLAAGVGPDGRKLPSSGWMALRRLGWTVTPPEDVLVSDRVRRVADEASARTLRLALHRRRIVRALLATWPADPRRRTDQEATALRAALPAGTSNAEIRNRTRQLVAWQNDHWRLPDGLTELEPAPRVAAVVLLAAADKQLTTIARTGPDTAEVRVQVPLVARPASRTDWAWHVLPVGLPVTVSAGASLCAPTLRVVKHQVRVDLPHRRPVPAVSPRGHAVAFGLDWGVNTVLTGTVGKLAATPSGTRAVGDGRRLRFDATGVSAKLHRLRGHRERLAAKRDQDAALLGGLPDPDPSGQRKLLETRHAVLATEHERVCARIRRLNHALAWSAARWATDQAVALGATVIYLEDLATLEARGRRKGNARLSGQVRGTVLDAIGHLAAKVGIPVVTVPARGTSKFCPRCGAALKHVTAPDRPQARGWKWAVCAGCGLSSDRDHAAAERITARGLLSQQHTRTDPDSGRHAITKSVDGSVARARRPKRQTQTVRRADRSVLSRRDRPRPTGRRRRPPSTRPQPATTTTRKTSRRVPDRRTVPAPTRPSRRPVGKRPAGQAPQTLLLRKGRDGSGPARDPLPILGRHQPGAGWGFHRNVTATPVLPLGTFGPVTARPRPVRIA